MTEPDPAPLPKAVRRPSRRWWLLGGGLLALAGLSLGTYAYFHYEAARRLREAIAAVDAADPGWRLEDLETARANIPDTENAALVVQAARARLPYPWPRYDLIVEALRDHKARNPLTDEQVQVLRQVFGPLQPSLDEARKLAGFATGRYPIRYAPDGYSTLLPHLDAFIPLEGLLGYDALLRAQEQDIAGALRSCRAVAVLGRSLGDEPIPISQRIRANCIQEALHHLERTLAQGQATDADLASLQELFEDEMAHPGYLQAMRGQRALVHRMLEAIETGQLTIKQLLRPPGTGSAWEAVSTLQQGAAVRMAHAQFLDDATEQVRRADQPFEMLPGPFHLPAGMRIDGPFSLDELLADVLDSDAPFFQYLQAKLRGGVVLLAAERYRLAHGRWPESVEAMVPQFLKQPTPDAYFGKPIRLRRFVDRLVIYSVGPDGVDDGGDLDRPEPGLWARDAGFCLWDVDKRHQPPAPAPAAGGATPPDK
jgi:hypothetical protein